MIDLDKLVHAEEAAAAEAVKAVEAFTRAAARDQPVNEARLVEALRRTGKTAAEFAAEVGWAKNRLAEVAIAAGIPEAGRLCRSYDADQAADDEQAAPFFAAYHERAATRRHLKSVAMGDLVAREQVKRELARDCPDGELRGRRARQETELSRLERELQKLLDARGHAEMMDNPQRYHADAVEGARLTLARTSAGIDRTRDGIDAAKTALAATDEEMSRS